MLDIDVLFTKEGHSLFGLNDYPSSSTPPQASESTDSIQNDIDQRPHTDMTEIPPQLAMFQDSFDANERILTQILNKVIMKRHCRSKGKLVCYLKGGGIAESAHDKHELAQVILAQYGDAFENHIVCAK
jgi:hypothetical protein